MILDYPIYVWLGVFPLLFFIFSLIKPTKFTKKILPPLIAMLVLLLLVRMGRVFLVNYLFFRGMIMLIVVAFPPATALLMALSGASALANRCSPWLAIPLTILDAAGCTGLYIGVLFAFFMKIIAAGHGLGTDHILIIKIIGGIETSVVLLFAYIIWKWRLEEKGNLDGV
jgi:hypothetical protein